MTKRRTTAQAAQKPSQPANAPAGSQRLDLPDHAKPKRPDAARPTTFDQQTVDAIFADIASGMSLRRACRLPDRPAESTVRLWVLNDHHGVAAQYARARELQAHSLVDMVIDIADEAPAGADPNLLRVRSDNAKWAAARILPKQYGDRIDVNANLSANVTVGWVIDCTPPTPVLEGTAVRLDQPAIGAPDPLHVVGDGSPTGSDGQ